jgi:hypothetical protein
MNILVNENFPQDAVAVRHDVNCQDPKGFENL